MGEWRRVDGINQNARVEFCYGEVDGSGVLVIFLNVTLSFVDSCPVQLGASHCMAKS